MQASRVNQVVSANDGPGDAHGMQARLARAIPFLRAAAPPRAPRDDPYGEGGTLTLVRRAWPYIYRYIGGRWIGFGAAGRDSDPGASGLLYMPLLVTTISALALFASNGVATQSSAGVYWTLVGRYLGLALAGVAWLIWATRGRWRLGLALAGTVIGIAAAVLAWIAEASLVGKALGALLLGAYLAGAALRIRLRDGLAVWVRVESHLVYYYMLYAACTTLIALNGAFLTDILYQSVLSGRPTGFSELVGQLGSGDGGALGDRQRLNLQLYYSALYMAGFLFSVPTLYVGLPYYFTYVHQKINQNLRMDLMDRWHQLSPRYHANHRVGDSIYRIYLDSAQISSIISRLQMSFTSALSWATACVIALFFDWRIAAFVLGTAVPLAIWAWWYTPRLKRRALAAREATSDLTSRAQEILTGLRVIKAYGQEAREQARFEADSVAAFDAALQARWLFVLIGVVSFTLCAFLMMPVLYQMAVWASTGRATLAAGLIALVGVSFSRWNLASFTWAHGRFGQGATSLRDLNTEWASAQDNAAGLTRVFDILETEPEVVDHEAAQALSKFERDIRFEHVGFAYEADRPVLRDISFTVNAGSVVAIVGPTGSGKSTLMALLLRLFDPDRGRILIDDQDLRTLTIASLREQIAIAPQEPVLFATTVGENLRYVAPDADHATVATAARVACVDDFLSDLPHGWDTPLGERGAGLSPGQKQRLCVARALVKEAPILILDEPTASLDAETEHRLMRNLAGWASGRVVFVITHRLSTIQHADHILFIEDGEVVEAGAHAALMARDAGRYRAMVRAERQAAMAEAAS